MARDPRNPLGLSVPSFGRSPLMQEYDAFEEDWGVPSDDVPAPPPVPVAITAASRAPTRPSPASAIEILRSNPTEFPQDYSRPLDRRSEGSLSTASDMRGRIRAKQYIDELYGPPAQGPSPLQRQIQAEHERQQYESLLPRGSESRVLATLPPGVAEGRYAAGGSFAPPPIPGSVYRPDGTQPIPEYAPPAPEPGSREGIALDEQSSAQDLSANLQMALDDIEANPAITAENKTKARNELMRLYSLLRTGRMPSEPRQNPINDILQRAAE